MIYIYPSRVWAREIAVCNFKQPSMENNEKKTKCARKINIFILARTKTEFSESGTVKVIQMCKKKISTASVRREKQLSNIITTRLSN